MYGQTDNLPQQYRAL